MTEKEFATLKTTVLLDEAIRLLREVFVQLDFNNMGETAPVVTLAEFKDAVDIHKIWQLHRKLQDAIKIDSVEDALPTMTNSK